MAAKLTASSTFSDRASSAAAGCQRSKHDRRVATVRLLELPDHDPARPGGSPPVDPAATVAPLPGPQPVEIAVDAGPMFAAVVAGERFVPQGVPTLRQAAQAAARPSTWPSCRNCSE